MRIAITGTPGTGKTAVARALSKQLGLKVVSVRGLVRKKRLYSRKEKGVYVVNLAKLAKALRSFEGVAEGHLLCEIRIPADVMLVLRLDPRVLKKRLSRRPYPKSKILENVEAEAIDYCAIRARKNYRRVIEINTTRKTIAQVVRKIVRAMKTRKGDRVDFSQYFILGASSSR
jgi:adenylate kinase